MASLQIRHFNDADMPFLKSIAKSNGYTGVETFLRDHLKKLIEAEREKSYAAIKAHLDTFERRHGTLPAGTGTAMIREDRDEGSN